MPATPEEYADIVAQRVVIEQAKGMLMMIYGIDADQAFELLKSRSQTTNVKLRVIARQLIEQFLALTDDVGPARRAEYDAVLRTAYERTGAEQV